jgi:hypothetical protein
MPGCDRESADDRTRGGLCEEHAPNDTSKSLSMAIAGERRETPVEHGNWGEADFTDPEGGTWPPELLEREQWMGHVEKKPFAPWGDPNAPAECSKNGHDTAATCDCDARWKWGHTDLYVDGETVGMAETDPRVDGRAFLQQPDDPYAYVDGDDVRDPATGEVHPAFIDALEQLGLTYADVSTSGAGVHANFRGDLPDGVKQATWDLDTEPWGENDELPSIEIYAGKRVCVATGEHVPGTPTDVREWDDDALRTLLDENDQLPEPRDDPVAAREAFDLEDYEPTASETDDVTDDIRDVFVALDRLDARRVAEDTIVHSWNDTASTSGDNRAFVPTWGVNATGTANIVNREIWQDTGGGGYGGPVVMALIAAGELSPGRATPRDATGSLWFEGIDYLRDLGYSVPRYVSGGDDDAEEADPTTLDITLDPVTAWEAAATVTPEDTPTVQLEPTPDGEGWIDPFTGDPIGDVARAVGVAEGDIPRADADLEGDTYHRLYHRARDAYDAPIPEYVDTAEATARWDVVRAAIGQLDFYDLDRTALKSDVTDEGSDVDGEAALTLDPAWRPSESGESVLVFDSGAVYDGDTDTTVDPLRLVALEAGLMHTPTASLEGEEFRAAYRTAREEYGAPLPTWKVGTPDVTAVLPRAEELVGAAPENHPGLQAARDRTEELYRDLATSRGAHLLNVLPGLGKTHAAIKTATDVPTTYLAGRKELMAAAADRADEFGASHRYLPVFSADKPDTDVLDEAVAAVRQDDKDLLREPWRLREAVSGEVFPDTDADDEDEIDLGRPTCETAEGEHGDKWALAVHVARELDYTPRDIHELAHGLFGDTLPCQHDGDCPYSVGWDAVSDPDNPADLLIGHPVHAHVQSARTYYTRDGRGQGRKESNRAVVVDEFPGTVYARDFGPEFTDHATWLARALRSDVEDLQDLFEADLWPDEWVRAWLRGEGDDYEPVADLLAYVKDRRRKIHAVNTAEAVLEDYRDLAADWNLEAPLAELVAAYPDLGDVREEVVRDVRAAVEAVPPEAAGFRVITWIRDDVLSPLESVEGATADVDDTPISGELRRFLTDALEDAREGKNGAEDALDNAECALLGGDRGARALSVYADDADAHRLANKLLEGVIAPDEEADPATRIATESFAYGDDADGTTLKHAEAADETTILVDRDHGGATVLDTPDRTAADGKDVPLIGLDATGRERLWSLAIGADVERADIHDTPRERARFLREHMDLQVVKTADRIRSYEGNPKGKDLDGDVALIERIREEYAGVHGATDGDPVTVGDPAVITTKCVRDVLEDDDRLRDGVSEWDNYGNVAGSNSLGEHKLAAVLGSQHYGDHAVEYMAALAGEEVSRSGRGHTLDYGSPVANAYLKHMREDQTMQAVLRFTRGGSGAIVFARTAALREDLPVVAEGHVMNSWNATATTLARELRRRRGEEFTVADVAGAVDVTKTQVRRILDEFAQLGYVDKHETPNGLANEFTATDAPGAGEVDLPSDVDGVTADDPNDAPIDRYYTANVRVVPPDTDAIRGIRGAVPVLPAPDATVEADPPG